MRSLPTWAIYAIAGLAAVVMVLLGTTGTLLVNDRGTIIKTLDKVDKTFEKFDEMLRQQNVQISELTRNNERQNHVMDKMCWLLTFDYKQRKELIERYPLIPMNPNNRAMP